MNALAAGARQSIPSTAATTTAARAPMPMCAPYTCTLIKRSSRAAHIRGICVWIGAPGCSSIAANRSRRLSMLYTLFGWLHAVLERRARSLYAALQAERGQGTVEYVGLILLVSLLMVGMVAAMK